MRKINSLYIEFEPVTPMLWHYVRNELKHAMRDLEIITYETGIVHTPDTQQAQQDWVGPGED